MGKFTVTHEINCTMDKFWSTFLDKNFSERLFKEGLAFPSYTITRQEDSATELIRQVVAVPRLTLPGPVARLMGGSYQYTEDGRFNKATQIWTFKVTPATLADKIQQAGLQRVEAIGTNKVRRITDFSAEARIFGVGGLLESTIEKQARESSDASARFMNTWLLTHP